MPAFKRSLTLALACTAFIAFAAPTGAFSLIGREDGKAQDGDGVIAAPLPPLQAPSAGPTATTAQEKTGPQPPAVAAPPPATSPASTATPPPTPQPTAPADNGAAATPQPVAPGGATPLAPDTGKVAPSAPSPNADAPATGGAGATDNETDSGSDDSAASGQAMPKEPSGPPPDVVYGEAQLPAPVRELRAKLIEAARSGEIEKLRAFIEPGEDGTVLSFGGVEGDPIEYMKSSSGDGEGVETMAILLEVLESGHIRNEPGTESEIYVWPYFTGLRIDKLTKPQQVELFRLVTAGDYQEMKAFGAYNFYRVGITPDGKLQFFVAGD